MATKKDPVKKAGGTIKRTDQIEKIIGSRVHPDHPQHPQRDNPSSPSTVTIQRGTPKNQESGQSNEKPKKEEYKKGGYKKVTQIKGTTKKNTGR